jgi:membrane associated rhomboid family serine protease
MYKSSIKPVLTFVTILYLILFIDYIFPFGISSFGIVPRTKIGLIGIITSPFLHANLNHLLSNTAPLCLLLTILLIFYKRKALPVIIGIVFIGGSLVWSFAREANHIGASGLIYGLVGFLIANGVITRNFKAATIALIIAVLYGGLVYGLLPSDKGISWEGHLFGAIGGIITSYKLSKNRERTTNLH